MTVESDRWRGPLVRSCFQYTVIPAGIEWEETMLIINPPLSRDDWRNARVRDRQFRVLFSDYCNAYQSSVLSLPENQIDRILRHMTRGMERVRIGPAVLHMIVENELREQEFELSSKVARLIILDALGSSLNDYIEIQPEIMVLLRNCRELIPAVLMMAVNDHYAFIEEPVRSS